MCRPLRAFGGCICCNAAAYIVCPRVGGDGDDEGDESGFGEVDVGVGVIEAECLGTGIRLFAASR